jgi:hypothetical protein
MPQTRSQSRTLSQILYDEKPSASSNQVIAIADRTTTSHPETIQESSSNKSVASIEPPNPTALNLESYKRTQDREKPPPSPKRARLEVQQVSPVRNSRNTQEEDYPNLPKFADLLRLKPELRSGLEQGYSRNFSCGPSGYRLTLASELLAEIEDIDISRCGLLEELGLLEQTKRKKLESLERILEIQKEELKISTIAEFGNHLQQNTLDSRQPTTTFDKFGIEIQTHDVVEVHNPYTDLLEDGTVKEVLGNNVALIRLHNSDNIVGLFGDAIRSLEE